MSCFVKKTQWRQPKKKQVGAFVSNREITKMSRSCYRKISM